MLRRASWGSRLKATLPIAARLHSHCNVPAGHLNTRPLQRSASPRGRLRHRHQRNRDSAKSTKALDFQASCRLLLPDSAPLSPQLRRIEMMVLLKKVLIAGGFLVRASFARTAVLNPDCGVTAWPESRADRRELPQRCASCFNPRPRKVVRAACPKKARSRWKARCFRPCPTRLSA